MLIKMIWEKGDDSWDKQRDGKMLPESGKKEKRKEILSYKKYKGEKRIEVSFPGNDLKE